MLAADDDRQSEGGGAPARLTRRQAAVLALDVFGYSALMGQNEEETHLLVGAELARVDRTIERFAGHVFSFLGDGLLAEFPSAVAAFRCAMRVQANAARRNALQPPARRITYRIGLNWGEIVLDGNRVGGTTVNVAARLERLAQPGGICLSAAVLDSGGASPTGGVMLVGQHRLRNIRDPVIVYAVPPPSKNMRPEIGGSEEAAEALEFGDQRPSLAVLPFRTIRGGEEDAYFAAGMVDDIIRALGGLRHLVVVSRSSTLSYRSSPDLRRIGRELDVRYVLQGSVRRSGGALRIAVELNDAATKQTIWADHFDGEFAKIFELQDSIAVRTAGAIAPAVRDRELQRSLRKGENTVTAYDLTLQAIGRFYQHDRQALTEAEGLLRRAIALDPDYATPLTHLAYLHILRRAKGWAGDDYAERIIAYETARRASQLDGSDALALAIYGQLHGYLNKDHETALELLDRAVAISPSCALAWSFGSFTCGILGDTTTALQRAERAIRLAPIGPEVGPWHEHALSQAHYLAGNFDEAIEWGQIAAKHGGHSSNLRCLATALVAADRVEEARSVAQQILAVDPRFQCGTFRAYTPLKGGVADLFVERLRRAGLPD